MDIYIGKKGLVLGPYYLDEIQKRLAEDQLDGTELAWHEGLDEWIDVNEAVNGVASSEDEPAPETEEPSVETESAEESEPLDEETLEQVNKIKELISDGHADTAWQLIQSLNNPRIYEGLLEDCPIDSEGCVCVPGYLKENGNLFLKLLGKLPEDKLQQLTGLYLARNQITDVSPLKELTQLEKLTLSINEISDVSPLKELKQLTELYLGGNQITDVTPLKELTQPTRVELYSNLISDVSPLKELTQLTKLDLSGNQISDVTPLKELTQLTKLILWNNQISISDIEDLQEALPDCKSDIDY